MEKKTGKYFVKGHPNYHKGKSVNVDDIYRVANKYARGEATQAECAKELGVSIPTCVKWLKMIFEKGVIDRSLSFVDFGDE